MILFPELKEFLRQKGEPDYRYRQLQQAITKNLVDNFSEISSLSKELRGELASKFADFFLQAVSVRQDEDCLKFLWELADGCRAESVIIGEDGRYTVCFSTQAGCPLKCAFCASGTVGWRRNLTYLEMFMQVLAAAAYLRRRGRRLSNVVAMGMGEPFLNYDNLIKTLRAINSEAGLRLAARRISVSTAGIVPGIKKFAALPEQYNLAVSLHTPLAGQRRRLMPISKKYGLPSLLKAVDYYIKQSGRKVMLEYILLAGVNTSRTHQQALAAVAGCRLVHVNLVNYNQTTSHFKPVSRAEAEAILNNLKAAGVSVTLRRSAGGQIAAACGQLAGGASKLQIRE